MQPFIGRGAKVRVSVDGGTQVRWRSDGRELFYLAPDGRLIGVVIDPAAGASGLGTPLPLFKTQVAPIRSISRQQYVVSRDGQRFLISTTQEPTASPITLIINWRDTSNIVPNRRGP